MSKLKNPQNYQIFKLMPFFIILIFSIIFGESAGNVRKMTLITHEFDNFHRIMLTVPSNEDSLENTVPFVEKYPGSGEFNIIVSPIDTSYYFGRKMQKVRGNIPMRLTVTFPDSQTIMIRGITQPFDDIVCYHILGEENYIFDIYLKLPTETTFREQTIGLITHQSRVNDQVKQRQKKITPRLSDVKSDITIVGRRDKDNFGTISKALLMSFGVLIVFSLIITVSILLVRSMRKSKDQVHNAKKATIQKPVTDPANVGELISKGNDREQIIKSLMDSSGVSYDEANIMLNMSQGHLNVKA